MHALAGLTIVLALPSIKFSEVLGGTIPEGSPCNPSNDQIDPVTHKFSSDCDERTFCASASSTSKRRGSNSTTSGNSTSTVPAENGTCSKRLCRTDEFPFGYSAGEPLPPLCKQGSFCPDRGNGCQLLQAVGSACDMDRDYQCATGKRWSSFASDLNFNGSVCLQSTCM